MAATEPLQVDWEAFADERAAIKTILAAPAPCDTCSDIVRWQCSQNSACRDFAVYVNSGKVVNKDRASMRERWHRLFRGSDE